VRLDEHGGAIKCYEQALSFFFEYYGKENKEFIIFYNDIGYSFSQEKQYEKAIVYYKKVIALEQNTENIFIAMNNIGEAHYNAEQFKEAKAIFEDTVQL
jgi:tetratricopeptide (TPR) repeat protein